jgi:hypothetical protein
MIFGIKKTNHYKFFFLLFFLTFFSCEGVLLETDISDQEVVLVAPYNKAQFFSTSVTFSWENVTDATKYRLQIAKPNFENPLQIVLDTIVTNNSFTQQLPVADYEWRVTAINSAYKTPFTSRFFTVVSNDNFENNTVVLSTPVNNLVTKVLDQNLKWTTIIGATSYQVQIVDGSDEIINDQTITASNLSYSFPEGNYSWKVRAINGTAQTLYTSRKILIDATKPNTAVLSTPVDKSTTTVNDITFKWNRVPIIGSTEKDSIYIYTDSALTTLQLKSEVNNLFTKNLDDGTYYWYIKSFDLAGNSSEKSTVFNFTIN